jgi:periplasmic protein TonB
MFQSVINQPGLSAGRFGAGMWVSLMVHAGVFTGVLGLSGKAVEQLQKEPAELIFNVPQPPKGNPNPPSHAATPTQPKPKRAELVQPKKIPPPETEQKVVEAPPTPENKDTVAEALPYIPGSHPDGAEKGGVPGATFIAGLALGNNPGGTGEEVLPFGAGMTLPELLNGAALQYTREALEARVSGTVIARCTITWEGSVANCRIIKGLPYMDGAVLDALTTRRYRPVHFQGRPVSVSYTFNVKLRLP